MTITGRARSRPVAWIAVLVLALAALLAGCDNGSDGADGASAATPSVSCPPPQTTTTPGAQRTVLSGGEPRTYNVWLPTGYDGTKPVPLILDFHGAFGESLEHAQTSPISQQAPGRGYLLVAPQAVQGDASAVGWKSPGSGTMPDDVQFVVDLLAQLGENYCIDPDRRFATGMSSGAAFTTYLACRLDVWAGIAPISGINLVQPCVDRPPVPMVTFHGVNDTYVPYESEAPATLPDPNGYYLGDVETVVTQFALRNGCSPAPEVTEIVPSVLRQVYQGCGADTVLYTVEDGGHTYPGGAPLDPDTAAELGGQSTAVDSGASVLDFFDLQRRTRPAVEVPAPWAPSATDVPFATAPPTTAAAETDSPFVTVPSTP